MIVDSEQRELLKIKRDLLKRETQMREMRDRIALELNFLKENNLHYNLYYDFETVNWISNHLEVRQKDGYRGSHGDFQLDVDDRKALYTEKGEEDDFLRFKSILEFFNEISNKSMLIRCSLSGLPEIEISKYAFLSKPSLFLTGPETWLISSDKKYVIEKVSNKDVVRFIDLTNQEPVLRVKLLTVQA